MKNENNSTRQIEFIENNLITLFFCFLRVSIEATQTISPCSRYSVQTDCENGIAMKIDWMPETMANDVVTNESKRQWSHQSSFHFLIISISANDSKQFN